ncbi:MAG: esterase [Sulfurovum sp. FS06-10]|nr:MAG: esterase [Sulfurovum sp. FS06-10]
MIIYIHGFGSSGQGGKAKEFREYFKSIGEAFIAPSLSYVPKLAITTLEELINSYENVTLIGSSLGGYYAIYLAEKYGLKAVLINPAVESLKTLKRAINLTGYAPNYYDGSRFGWNASHLEMLKLYAVDEVASKDYLLLLQKGDDVLDYQEAIAKIPWAMMVIEEGGTHQFEGIERYFEQIRNFLIDQ